MYLKQIVIKLPLFLLAVAMIFGSLPAFADDEDITPPSVEEASAVYFYHLESQNEIIAKNTDLVISAGSTAKIMAGLLACEYLQNRLQDQVLLSDDMLSNTVPGSRNYKELTVGDVLTVEQLLYIALCGSYNNAYDALACYIAGSVEAFTERMNARARELGATNTTYTDVSGVDDSSMTTVSDLKKIALAAYQNSLYIKITSTMKYASPATEKMSAAYIDNYNALIGAGYNNSTKYYNAKCQGMNAGSTQRSGCCAVTVASNGTDRYLCIVMNAKKTDADNFSFIVANRLINWVYRTYAYMEVISPESVICTIPVTVSDMITEIPVKAKEPVYCYLPKGLVLGKDVTYSIRLLYPALEAPVQDGTMVGYVAIIYQGKVIDTLPVYTDGEAPRSSFMSGIKWLQDLIKNRVFCAGAIFFTLTLITWIVIEAFIIRRRKHRWDKYFSMKMNPSPTSSKFKLK